MTSAVDRTQDFVQSVQHCRSNHLNKNFISPLNGNANDECSQHLLGSLENRLGDSNFKSTRQSAKTNGNQPSRAARNAFQQRSEFMSAAAAIGRDLASTFGKLEQLNRLARQQSLFDDHGPEIQHLTCIVKDDMADLNHRIAALQSIAKSQTGSNKQRSTHSRSILMGLQTRLAQMTDQFRGLLECRSENLKTQAVRRAKYSAARPSDINGQSADSSMIQLHRPVPSMLLQDDERARQAARHEASISEGNDASTRIHIPVEQSVGLLKQQKQLSIVDQTDTYLTARADTMRSIEHTIVELGEIFQQLATMVQEQDESIRRIDTNVEEASVSIEAGHAELLRYLRSISSNRWLMIKVFAVLVIFFIVFVVFFV